MESHTGLEWFEDKMYIFWVNCRFKKCYEGKKHHITLTSQSNNVMVKLGEMCVYFNVKVSLICGE